MKNLKDVLEKLSIDNILEKLSIDNIALDAKFPIDGTTDDIIEFLKENDFKYVSCNGNIDEWFNNYKSKCFYKDGQYLWFGDTSKEKISEKNPIFTYRIWNNSFAVYYCGTKGKVYWLIGQKEKIKNSKENKEEFLKELNKCFGW